MGKPDYTGQILDAKYQIVEPLGRGGMGTVYLGKHLQIGREVAIKVLNNAHLSSERAIVRFYREAQAAAAVRHPNIIDVYDVGVTSDGDPYLVMELLHGESLASLLARSGELEPEQAVAIIAPVLRGLSAAHKKGVVHRDLKPENIYVCYEEGADPRVKLIDFGVSKIAADAHNSGLTGTGEAIGTPQYMSPEQAVSAGNVDHRSDIFAVGIILYEMLTGMRPFQGDNYPAILLAVMHSDPPPAPHTNPVYTEELEPIVKKALSKKAENRYQSAKEMLSELKKKNCWNTQTHALGSLDVQGMVFGAATGAMGTPLERAANKEFAGEHLKRIVDDAAQSQEKEFLKEDNQAWVTPPSGNVTETGRVRKTPWLKYIGLGILLVLMSVGIAHLFLINEPSPVASKNADSTSPQTAAAPLSLSPAKEKTTVKILISGNGVTGETKILYDNRPVQKNPFEVKIEERKVQVNIQSPGYKTFQTWIVPTYNQTLAVDLYPEPEETAGTLSGPDDPSGDQEPSAKQDDKGETKETAAAKSKSTKHSTKRKARDHAQAKKNVVRSGQKGVEFIEDFRLKKQ